MNQVDLIPDRKKMIAVKRVNGATTVSKRFDPHNVDHQTSTARLLGVTHESLVKWIGEVTEAPKTFEVLGAADNIEGTLVIKDFDGDHKSKYQGDFGNLLHHYLHSVPVDLLLSWSDRTVGCCLDIDYHGDRGPPDRSWLESIVFSRLSPRPLVWHFSRSGGLHLFYVGHDGFSADELAAAAGLRFKTIDPTAGIELKTQVRGPGSETLHWSTEQDTSGLINQWIGVQTADEKDIQDYCETEGIEFGRRYTHDRCPIHPTTDAGDKRDPVIVSEDGIFCFLCEGKGRSLGSRRSGYAPWAAILGSPSSGEIGRMVQNQTHWGHAKWVLKERLKIEETLAKLAYSAALKAWHKGRKSELLLPGAFMRDTDLMARVNDKWVNPNNGHVYKDHNGLLGALPVAQYISAKGDIKSSPARVQLLNQTDPEAMEAFGYSNIHIIHGFKLTDRYLDGVAANTVIAVPSVELQRAGSRFVPEYMEKAKWPMSLEEAWGTVEAIFPRLDRKLITLLICAAGCAQETRLGMTPFIFVAGVSGSAKSTHPQIAAAILGTRAVEPVFTPDNERFRQSIREGLGSGPILIINEVFKDAARSRGKLSPIQALEPILTLTEESLSHELYRGPTKIGRPFVIVFTDVLMPPTVFEDIQIARRLRYHRVIGKKEEWTESIAKVGLTNINNLRLLNQTVATACNVILSDIIDTYFSLPMTFDEMADKIGISTLEKSTEFDNPIPLMRQFFKMICEAPALSEQHRKKYRGEGYKRIGKDNNGDTNPDLRDLYTSFADGIAGVDWVTSRRLTAMDWSKVLGVSEPVEFVLKTDNSSVYVRFIVGASNRPRLINQQIVDPSTWEE